MFGVHHLRGRNLLYFVVFLENIALFPLSFRLSLSLYSQRQLAGTPREEQEWHGVRAPARGAPQHRAFLFAFCRLWIHTGSARRVLGPEIPISWLNSERHGKGVRKNARGERQKRPLSGVSVCRPERDAHGSRRDADGNKPHPGNVLPALCFETLFLLSGLIARSWPVQARFCRPSPASCPLFCPPGRGPLVALPALPGGCSGPGRWAPAFSVPLSPSRLVQCPALQFGQGGEANFSLWGNFGAMKEFPLSISQHPDVTILGTMAYLSKLRK